MGVWGVVGLAENKVNSAPIELELEHGLGLSLAIFLSACCYCALCVSWGIPGDRWGAGDRSIEHNLVHLDKIWDCKILSHRNNQNKILSNF